MASGRAERGAPAWRVPRGPSSLTLPPPVPVRQAISGVRSSRREAPRGPGAVATRGATPPPRQGAVRMPVPVLRTRQRGQQAPVTKTHATEPSRVVGAKRVAERGTHSPRRGGRGGRFSEEAHVTAASGPRGPEHTLSGNDFSSGKKDGLKCTT